MDKYLVEVFITMEIALVVSLVAKLFIWAMRRMDRNGSSEKLLKREQKIWRLSIYFVVFLVGSKIFKFF